MSGSTAPAAQRQASSDGDAAPPCPICLAEIERDADRAVVLDCMHVFCVPCISRWAKLRRECPLCKGFFKAFIHGIVSASDFQERQLSPLRDPAKAADADPVAALLRDAREQYSDWRLRQLLGRGGGGGHAPHSSSGSRGGSRSSRATNPERQGPLTEPRPYYFRLQRNLNARVAGTYGQAPAPASPADQALQWRASIYSRRLWAQPVALPGSRGEGGGSGRGVPAAVTAPGGDRRLEDWVTRELQALLNQDDVVIVKGLVLGLLRSHGLTGAGHRAGGSAAAQQTAVATAAAQRQVSPMDALRPFLDEHAEHFWHELSNFAAAPFSIPTYDRMVRYGGPEAASSSAAAGIALAASRQQQLTQGRRSRWDVQPVGRQWRGLSFAAGGGGVGTGTSTGGSSGGGTGSAAAASEPGAPQPAAAPHVGPRPGDALRERSPGSAAAAASGELPARPAAGPESSGAQPAAELEALRNRALWANSGRASEDHACRRRRQREQRQRSPSPRRQRRRRRRRESPREPQHRKRQARREGQLIASDARHNEDVQSGGGSDDDRWQMN